MKEKIFQLVQEYGDVTFVELAQKIEGFTGDMQFVNTHLDNVVLWHGVSNEGIDALIDLLKNEKIFISKCKLAVYWYHGFGGFPALETIDVEKSVTTPSWLPVILLREPPVQR